MTTPYPGSKLYEIAKKHGLFNEGTETNWEKFDSGAGFLMKLPGIGKKDWLVVYNAGKRLQAFLLIRSGTFNLKALPLYIKKALYMIKKSLF